MVTIKLEEGHTVYTEPHKVLIVLECDTQFYGCDIASILARQLNIEGVDIKDVRYAESWKKLESIAHNMDIRGK